MLVNMKAKFDNYTRHDQTFILHRVQQAAGAGGMS